MMRVSSKMQYIKGTSYIKGTVLFIYIKGTVLLM